MRPPKLPASLIPIAGTLSGAKRRYRSARLTRKSIAHQLAHPARFEPPKLADVRVHRADAEGWPVFTVTPAAPTGATAVYFHGGSYVHEITSRHWRLVADLARTTGTTFVVPIYTLAPLMTAESTVPAATRLVARSGASVVLGDSAGGGLALATALEHGGGLPTVLISPWLDLSLSDPAIRALDRVDPWLSVVGLRICADAYRGGLPVTDRRVSPLRGDLRRAGPITVFSGTRDLLNADARRLVERATAAGVPIDLHEEPGMVHVYPILPVAEAEPARETMRQVLRRLG